MSEHKNSLDWLIARRDKLEIDNEALLDACKAQHDAMDMLFALLISTRGDYLPSKSGKPWEAMLQGNAAIAQAEK